MTRTHLYAVFHLNLAYSSIEEEQRSEVIRRCYWPLLRLARELQLPFGIEATGYTLEAAAAVDPAWLAELQGLVTNGPCEFIGSGYAQLIGPLVPAEVNAANLRLGHAAYRQLLGVRPRIALINEQAYSSGLVPLYREAGYEAIIMEWDNPARHHPDWDPAWRYLPQQAVGPRGETIPVIWGKSIAFQKFQRYAHGEMDLEEYLEYLHNHTADALRAFPLYANDVEIFDFRPGRYHTEAALQEESEWLRLRRLFTTLQADSRFAFVKPSVVLDLLDQPGAGNRLHLESPAQPVPVKKQGKYNVTRWAITGRNDLGINTDCWRIYQHLRQDPAATDDDWRELCYLWSSDFRTHITPRRWERYRSRLKAMLQRNSLLPALASPPRTEPPGAQHLAPAEQVRPRVHREGRYLWVETGSVTLQLNCRRGLAIAGLWFGPPESQPLCGTLAHGYYDDIALGSDWYTGHTVLEAPGQPKVTDLNPVEPVVSVAEDGSVRIEGVVPTQLGAIVKELHVPAGQPQVQLQYRFQWQHLPMGSFRLGHITLHPERFDRATLYYRTTNGGRHPETFPLAGSAVNHGEAVSFLVSASSAIGLTEGWAELGDARQSLRVEVDQTKAALVGLIHYQELPPDSSYFFRLALSAGEMDETRRHFDGAVDPRVVSITLSPGKS